MKGTPVIFRVWKASVDKDVIAFLPTYSANVGRMWSYEIIGESGEADYNQLLSVTRLATEEEYRDTLRILDGQSATEEDRLTVVKRDREWYRRERWAEYNRVTGV